MMPINSICRALLKNQKDPILLNSYINHYYSLTVINHKIGSKIKTPFLNTSSVNQIFSAGIKYLPPYPGCAASAFCADP